VLTESEAPRLLAYLRDHVAGFSDARIGRFADAVYVRETRHVLGDEWLTADDVWTHHARRPDRPEFVSARPASGHGERSARVRAIRHVYGVRSGARSARFYQLAPCEPSISASHEAAGSARDPTTIEEGEPPARPLLKPRTAHLDCGLAASPPEIAALQVTCDATARSSTTGAANTANFSNPHAAERV